MASGPPLVPLAELDSPFQLQEHLKALYYAHTKSTNSTHQVPITRETALILAQPPENVERSLWLYELCRFLTQRANNLIVAFFAESPACSAQTCPEMRASEWQYLCAVHDPPKSCCAIDYCCHTLDWASSILTSQKHYPSRLTLGSESTGGTQQGVRQLTNIFRRVYRIFAHAWFQHRQVFWQVEGCDGLYMFFKTVCDYYALIPEDNYTIPPEAEGIVEDDGSEKEQEKEKSAGLSDEEHGHGQMTILKKEDESNSGEDADATTTISMGATTRRHKHTPSTGSAVTTIAEGDEEEKEHKEEKGKESSPETKPAETEDQDEEKDDNEEEEGTEEEPQPIPAHTDEDPTIQGPTTQTHKDSKADDHDDENTHANEDPEHDSATDSDSDSQHEAFSPVPTPEPVSAHDLHSHDAHKQDNNDPPSAEAQAQEKAKEAAKEETHTDSSVPVATHAHSHDLENTEKETETAAEAKPEVETSVSEEDAASAVEEGAGSCSLEKVEG